MRCNLTGAVLACVLAPACLNSALYTPGDTGGSSIVISSATALADGNQTVEVTVNVREASGLPIRGVALNITARGCDVEQSALSTDANGVVSAIVRSTIVGSHRLAASLIYNAFVESVAEPVVVTFAQPAPGHAITAGTTVDFALMAENAAGQANSAYTGNVEFVSTDPFATLPAPVTLTAKDAGYLFVSQGVTLRTSGIQTVSAVDVSSGAILCSTTYTVAPLGTSRLVLTGLALTTPAGGTVPLTVSAYDALNNVTPYTGTVTFATSDSNASLPASYTFLPGDGGTHVFSPGVALVSHGVQTVTVSDINNGALNAVLTTTVIPAPPANLTVVPATTAVANVASPVQITLVDAFGNRDIAYTGTVTLTSSDPTVSPLVYTFQAADAGAKTLQVIFLTGGQQTIFVVDSAHQLSGQATVVVTHGPLDHVVLTGLPAQTVAGVPNVVTLQAYDRWNNTDTDYLGVIAFQSTDPNAVLPTPYYAFSLSNRGVANFTFTFVTAGAQTVTLTDLTTFNSLVGTITVNAQSQAKRLQLTVNPTTATVGNGITPSVTAVDAFGNRVAGYTGTITFSSDDPAATLPASTLLQNANQGTASWPSGVVWRTAGTHMLRAADTQGVLQAGVISMSAAATTPLTLTFLTQPATTPACGMLPTLRVGAQDQFGNAVGLTQTVYLSLQPNVTLQTLLRGTTAQAPVANVAAFSNVHIDQVGGPYVLVANASGLVAAHSAGFSTSASMPTVTVGSATVVQGIASIPYTVQSTCPVTVMPSFDPNGLGVFTNLRTVAGGIGVQNLKATTAVHGVLKWDTVHDLPQVAKTVTFQATAKSLVGQVTATTSVAVSNATTLQTPRTVAAPHTQNCERVADVNHDATPDLLTCDTNAVVVWLGDPNGSGVLTAFGQYPVAAMPTAIVTGDFNRDGAVDAVVSLPSTGKVAFLPGGNSGALGSAIASTFGTSPGALAAADVNKDGVLDLVGVDTTGNLLLWAKGVGDGTFTGVQSTPAGGVPSALALDDYNRDGYVDAAVAHSAGASIMFGNATGFAAFSAHPGAPTTPTSIVSADVNSDGKADLVIGGSGGWAVNLGAAAGAFTAGSSGASPTAVRTVGVGDINADGKADIVLGSNVAGSTPWVLLNSGTGTFGASTLAGTSAAGVAFVQLTDLNRDGQLDIATVDSAATVSTYINLRAPSPLIGLEGPLSQTGLEPNTMANGVAADVNEDGLIDSVSVSGAPQNVMTVNINDGSGHLQFLRSIPVGKNPIGLVVQDFNGDGHLDAVVLNYGESSMMTLLGDGTGNFTVMQVRFAGQGPAGIVAQDLDGDGILDLALSAASDGNIGILRGVGDGNFTMLGVYPTGIQPVNLALGDVNADGAPDIAVVNADGAAGMYTLFNNGSGQFATVAGRALDALVGVILPKGLWLSDLNGDHLVDLLNSSTGVVTVVFNHGGSVSATGGSSWSSGVLATSTTLPVDVDINGSMDILTHWGDSQSLIVEKNNGSGGFSQLAPFLGTGGVLVFSADMNGDGIPDAVLGGSGSAQGTGTVMFNQGSPNYFSAPAVARSGLTAVYAAGLVLADMDRDGSLDAVIQSNGQATTSASALMVGRGPSFSSALSTYPLNLGARGMAVGDIDNDGWPDAVACDNNALLYVFLNTLHTGTLTAVNPNAVPFYPQSPIIRDFNRDGWRDILFIDATSNTSVGYLPNSGAGTFGTTLTSVLSVTGDTLSAVAAGDVDNNGTVDIVALGGINIDIKLLDGNGMPVGGTSANTTLGNSIQAKALLLTDFNRDGTLDLVLAGQGLGVALGQGNGTFSTLTSFNATTSGLTALAAGDFNQDGRIDLVATGTTTPASPLLVAYGNGLGGIASQQLLAKTRNWINFAVGDADGDGKVDLANLFSGNPSNVMAVYYNRE